MNNFETESIITEYESNDDSSYIKEYEWIKKYDDVYFSILVRDMQDGNREINNLKFYNSGTISNTRSEMRGVSVLNTLFTGPHDLYKNYYLLGSVFMDYRTNLLDKKIIIYGHTFKYYDTDFDVLEKYLSYEFYNNNKYIEINTDNNHMLYEIFSIYLTKDDYEYFDIEISDYNRHFNNLKNNSMFETNVEVNDKDNVLILQTCSSNYEDYFVIVCAKRIEMRKI